jgi:Xaa-Pro dipeptidase
MCPNNDCPSSTRRSFLSTGVTLAAGAGIASAGLVSSCASTGQAQDETGRLDEMFASLIDRSKEASPIQADERTLRRQRLGELLQRANYDSMLVGPCATMEYLTGVKWGRSERLFALVVLADGSHFWLCPAFEAEKAKLKTEGDGKPGGDIVTWEEHEYAFAPLHSELRRRKAEHLCIEPSLPYTFVDGLAQEMKQAPAPSGRSFVTELRGRKDAHELELLRLANVITQQAILAASEWIRPGMTGQEIGALVRHAHTRLGLINHWDLSLVGPAAAYPHGQTRDVEIKAGEMLLIDTGGELHGYQSDNTRSWVFDGEPTERQARVWHAVHAAQRASFDWIQPGLRSGDGDLVARRYLEEAGLTQGYSTFSHRLGHGIGMQGHEDPYFDSGSDVILREGMTLSLEPGIYLYGEFGVRIEDIIAVGAEGAEHFGSWQQDPRSPR